MRTKNIHFLLAIPVFFLLLAASCQKEDMFASEVQLKYPVGTWKLQGSVNENTNTNQIVFTHERSDSYQLTFKKDSTWFGTSSTNQLTGTYTIDLARKLIKLNETGTTKIAEYGFGDQYLQRLHEVFSYKVDENELRLYYTKENYLRYLPYTPPTK